jgi:hypothetical protein
MGASVLMAMDMTMLELMRCISAFPDIRQDMTRRLNQLIETLPHGGIPGIHENLAAYMQALNETTETTH